MKGCGPMKISQEEIKKIALLSRLEVKEDKMASVEKELSDILTYVAELNELELDDVEVWLMLFLCIMCLEKMKLNLLRSRFSIV